MVMLPGFTATNSLGPAAGIYYGGASLAIGEDGVVNPEFLGVIKEAFESAYEGVEGGLSAMMTAISHLVQQAGTNFVCTQWAVEAFRCSGGNPPLTSAEMLANCMGANPDNTLPCLGIVASMYPAVVQFCANGGGDPVIQAGLACRP
jgi:hypothetical protein